MAYQFDKEKREEAATRIKEHMKIHKMSEPNAILISQALEFAISELLRPNPCDNCVGVGLAVSHGYTDMRLKTEEDD